MRDKDRSVRPSHPIMRRPGADLEEKHELRGGIVNGEGGRAVLNGYTPIRRRGETPKCVSFGLMRIMRDDMEGGSRT